MKFFHLIIPFCFLFISSNAQTRNWIWAEDAPSDWYEDGGTAGNAITIDSHGNIYVTGSYYYSDTLGSYSLTGSGPFIAKYDTAGNVLWAKGSVAAAYGGGDAISLDEQGNIYVTGVYDSTLTLGSFFLSNPTNVGTYNENYFIAKYDSAGNVLWASTATSSYGDAYGTSICTDTAGNIYVSGTYNSSSINVGGYTFVNNDTNLGYDDPYGPGNYFVTKYSPQGNVIWAVTGKSAPIKYTASATVYGICTDIDGNLYLAGSYSDSLFLGNYTLVSDSLSDDIFISKYTPSGNVIWAKTFGGNGIDYPVAIELDAAKNLYIAGGYTSSELVFGNDTLAGDGLHEDEDIFIAKLNSSGDAVWAKSGGADMFDAVNCMSTIVKGNLYVSGVFGGPSISFGNTILTNTGFQNLFMVDYDTAGNLIWADVIDVDSAQTGGICADSDGNVYLTGGFFGSGGKFGNYDLAKGFLGFEYFIGKYGETTETSGVNDIQNTPLSVRAFPNPTDGVVYFTGMNEGDKIEIYNAVGALVQIATIDNYSYQANLNGEAKGIYFYKITGTSKGVQQGKIVLQ